jgi:hypothetical protein
VRARMFGNSGLARTVVCALAVLFFAAAAGIWLLARRSAASPTATEGDTPPRQHALGFLPEKIDPSEVRPVATVEGPAAAEPPDVILTAGEPAQVLEAFRRLASLADRPQFDPRARARTLGTDPGAAFAFVRDRISNELYPGVLRGASGTLQAGAGNDLDKATLLAELLGERRVRFAHCTLPMVEAAKRVATFSMLQPSPPPSFEDDARLQDAFVKAGIPAARAAQLIDRRALRRGWLDAAVFRTALADLATLRSVLESAGIRPAPGQDSGVTGEARSHYWLQLESAGGWQDLDASTSTMRPGDRMCEPDSATPALPDSAYQSIAISVRNQTIDQGTARDTVVLTRRFRVADLYGRVVTFTNVGIKSGSGLMAGTRVDRAVPFLLLGDEVFPGTEFELLPSTSGGPAALFDDALGGGEPPAGLSAQYLDFRIDAPGRTTTVTRTVIAPGPDGSSDADVMQASLAQTYAIAVSAGPMAPAVALDGILAQLEPATLEAAFASPTVDGGAETRRRIAVANLDAVRLRLVAAAYACRSERALAALAARLQSVRLVRDRPTITIANRGIRQRSNDGTRVSEIWVDFRHHRVRVVAQPEHAADGFWANVLHGLVSGALERHMRPASGPGFDTSTAFGLARNQSVELVASQGAAATQQLAEVFTPQAASQVKAALGPAIAVVAPTRPVLVERESRMALWALDSRTGHVLPLVDTGLHGDAAAERAALEAEVKELEMLVRQCVASPARVGECRRLFSLWKKAAQALADHVSNYPWSTPVNFPVEIIYFF